VPRRRLASVAGKLFNVVQENYRFGALSDRRVAAPCTARLSAPIEIT
jgi:hypothetical protein